jgi:N-acetylmuramoyl-L-alanine amidase
MPYTTRELLARLLMCEADGEGYTGMQAVASVIVNRTNVPYGEFFRVSKGGDMRAIITQARSVHLHERSCGRGL